MTTQTLESTAQSTQQLPEIQEIALAISIKNLSPTILTEDFLKFRGIIPSDWKLVKRPIFSPKLSKLTFHNKVTITAQPGSIAFVELINNQAHDHLEISQVATNLIEKLPNAGYQHLKISPKKIVPLSNTQEDHHNYITKFLLAPGPWQEFGEKPVQTGIHFLYHLQDCQLSLNVNQAAIGKKDEPSTPALLFSGTFHHQITENEESQQLEHLKQHIHNWQNRWNTFQELINNRFLR